MDALRIGIVGARRAHQGLGPFVARDLVALGAEVTHVLGRTDETARAAATEIAGQTSAEPVPLSEPDEFDAAPLDAVCVLTPRGHHLEWVERALAVKRHVLVEKPVIWHGPDAAEGTSWRARVDDLGRRFAERGLVLAVNAQWPWTLPAFAALHGAPEETPRALEMGLAPASSGRAMLGDALPHPLSLALALRPDLERLTSCSFDLDGAARCEMRAELSGADGTFSLRVELVGRELGGARAAWYAVDGRRVDRCVREQDYALFLRDGARVVDLADPLRERLGTFLADVQRAEGAGRPARELDPRPGRIAGLLEAIDAAFPDQGSSAL